MDSDLPWRLLAIEHLHALSNRYDDMIPRDALLKNLEFEGRRLPLFNPQSGIHRPQLFRGPAALTIVTTPSKPGQPPPYEDAFDDVAGTIRYSYRRGPIDSPDNRALRSAFTEQVPMIYLLGVAPGWYSLAAPVYVVDDNPAERSVLVQIGSRITDLSPDGMRSDPEVRRYAVYEVQQRLHQHRFRYEVLAAYRGRCTICALRERALVQAAHIIEDGDPRGHAVVRNGLALCAIHHLAYDKHVLGIDPDGVVHIAPRLLKEVDGPMLREGLQSFHRQTIAMPQRLGHRPDRERLATRYERFLAA